MRISILNYWYKCQCCYTEHSVSSSSPLEYKEIITCPNCYTKFEVLGLKDEPQAELKKIKEGGGK